MSKNINKERNKNIFLPKFETTKGLAADDQKYVLDGKLLIKIINLYSYFVLKLKVKFVYAHLLGI